MNHAADWHDLVSQPQYEVILEEDVWVPMRDGVRLAVDLYRPDAEDRFPALVSWSWYGKDSEKLPTNPVYQTSDYVRGTGGHECGEQWYFVPRGYVQVVPDIRGIGKSEGDITFDWAKDGYDLIEWVAAQPWCNGNVGMVGMSAFAMSQYIIASERPPHLKAIFPFEGVTDWYRQFYYHGGIFCYLFPVHLGGLTPARSRSAPASLSKFSPEELRQKVEALKTDPDIQCTPYLYMIASFPQINPLVFDLLLHPHDGPYYHGISGYKRFDKIDVPSFMGTRWNGWVLHMPGDFDAFEKIPASDKKMLVVPSDNYGGMDRPFHEVQDVCLRWYDHWLKGIDTGMMDEPPILLFIQSKNTWRFENEWPLAATQWTKLYLREGGRLSESEPVGAEIPQIFTSEPWANPSQGFRSANTQLDADPVPKAVYETETLREEIEITGPIALYWHAAIESRGVEARTWKASEIETLEPVANDTDWYLKVKDIGPGGEELCVAEGWLKASHHEIDEGQSKPYAPFHPHTRSLLIEPGETILYTSDLRMASNLFAPGHRIRLEISAQDQVQALWYHLPHMAKVTHTVVSTANQPSYLLLPVIPKGYEGAGRPDHPPAGPFRIP